ncbi:hypothetical protein Nepgr_024563 [Nepenthes gracilis]|uniref:Thaumatin-like protein n=1 Tax=Nepenthes gracilis TaxID=150966 RepID=A0AAD3T4F5_NEPGR|nr:hypothetical protein Nepgr_024563 [Nepenthes gracilis]
MSQFTKFIILPSLLLALLYVSINTATFDITNNYSYTLWAAALSGGGQQLDLGQTWSINVNAGQIKGCIWARTGCNHSGTNGTNCQTGDCGGLLRCLGYGSPPNTLAEYTLNQYMKMDYIDRSVIDGFNIPMSFLLTSNGCTIGPTCTADVNGQCPSVLKAPGGCNNPCTIFKTDEYCCNFKNCDPTDYSKYFKGLCPDAFSYPKDYENTTYTCSGGTNYKVVFCP